jgi:hypothetical protein
LKATDRLIFVCLYRLFPSLLDASIISSLRRSCNGCPYRELYPAILMMKSAEDRLSSELAEPLDRPIARRILVQRQMRSKFVVIAGVGRKDPAQMA